MTSTLTKIMKVDFMLSFSCRSSRSQVLHRKAVLKSLRKFMGKPMVGSIKVFLLYIYIYIYIYSVMHFG